jgi:hypothetical protein
VKATSAPWTAALVGAVRVNPAYRLHALDTLPTRYRTRLEELGVDTARVAGLLVAAPASGLPDKVVDRPAAELVAGVADSGRPDLSSDRLAALVLDGVLEIEGAAGYACGPRAYAAAGAPAPAAAGAGRLARLSRAALEYAQRLQLDDVDGLTRRLYAYHRAPLSRRWERAYPDRDAVLELLPQRLLAARWLGPTDGGGRYWLSWSARGRSGERPSGFPYKLYVSPRIEELPTVLPAVVEALTAAGAIRFKIGSDAAGLLRPDKIVVYLRDAGETRVVADALARAVDGAPAHGVPFTAELAGDGGVSWGGDPPRDAGPIGRRSESWRLSVCRRLAELLHVAARAAVPGVRPVDFALTRLGLDGVDVASFAPSALPTPDPSPAGSAVSLP